LPVSDLFGRVAGSCSMRRGGLARRTRIDSLWLIENLDFEIELFIYRGWAIARAGCCR
jgi:hypothetical protein